MLFILGRVLGQHIQHLGETFLTNKLQDISKTQYPRTRLFQGTRSEDRIACKIGIVLTTSIDRSAKWVC